MMHRIVESLSPAAFQGLLANLALQVAVLSLFVIFGHWLSVLVLVILYVGVDAFFVWATRRSHRYHEAMKAELDKLMAQLPSDT